MRVASRRIRSDMLPGRRDTEVAGQRLDACLPIGRGVFQQLVNLSFEESIPEGGKFCSSLQNDVPIYLSPDNTLVIVAPRDHLAPRINDQAVTDKLCPSVDPCGVGGDEVGEILQRPC